MLTSFLRKRGALKPAWRYVSEGVLWRILISPGGRLVGESRDLQKMAVSFFCVDVRSGVALWEKATYGEQWWMGIEDLCGEVLLLHKYATPSMPEHKGILAIRGESGKLLWSHEDLMYEFNSTRSIVASQTTARGRQFVQVEVEGGLVERTLSEEEVRAMRERSSTSTDVITPTLVYDVADESSEVAAVVRNYCDIQKLMGRVEFLEHEGMVIVSFRERGPFSSDGQARMNNILRIVERGNGKVLFESKVNADFEAAGTFLLRENMLFYIDERAALTAFDLSTANEQ
jgi:hypothetical protein